MQLAPTLTRPSPILPPRVPGDQLKLFQAVIPVFRFDIPTSLFLMPYLVGGWVQRRLLLGRKGWQPAGSMGHTRTLPACVQPRS